MNNLLDPAILFFVFGVLAGTLKSNLEIPPQISRFLSLYLLMALGLKGGFALAKSGMTVEVVTTLGIASSLAMAIPALSFTILKRCLSGYDAAAISATYGSVSAVTFITAVQYLENHGLNYGGHMAAAMALMESPAIVMAVLFANRLRKGQGLRTVAIPNSAMPAPAGSRTSGISFKSLLHESLTDGAQLLLLGAMVIGLLTGELGQKALAPFSIDLFKGMLAFFLLDMGLLAARNLGELRGKSTWLLLYAILAPLVHAAFALVMAVALGVTAGNTALLMTLAASASYIAVPAVLRYAIPEAKPSLYFGMSLGLTFPFNIMIGIPIYAKISHWVLG